MPSTTFDSTDRSLMNLLQSAFPLAEEPFSELGSKLGIPEAEVISRVKALKRKNVVRQIGAIFDTRRLGYKSTLVAMHFPDGKLHRGAQIINRHPGVSHNYARNGTFNLWFTLATPPGRPIDEEVEMLARVAGATATRILPTVRFFKIGVNFDMEREVSDARTYFVPDDGLKSAQPAGDWNKAEQLSGKDIAFIKEFQEDLPLVSRPFDGMAERLGISVRELFAYADEMVRRRLMRRYSAVLYHRRAGFSSNAMIVWQVPEERAQQVGEIMARSPWVTHCYQRPTYDDWKYTHFTMVHATSKEQCEQVAREIEGATGITERMLLYSTREYKKTRVRYFVEDEFNVPEAVPAG